MNAKTGEGASFSLLLAVDGSAHADAAALWVASLGATRRGVRCVLLNVQKPVMTGEVGVISPASIAMAARARHSKEILDAAASVLQRAGLAFTTERITDDDTATAALSCAEACGCNAIVVGRRGHGALRAGLLGSVSASVMRQAALPVFIINSGGPPPSAAPLRILVAYDGSMAARHAAMAAANFASQTGGAEIHLLHVRPDLTVAGAIFGPRDQLLQHWSGVDGIPAIAEVRGAIETMGCTCTVREVFGDHAGEEILRAVDDAGFGMIAMGTRGLGPVAGLLLGSVAQYVVERAHVPALLAK